VVSVAMEEEVGKMGKRIGPEYKNSFEQMKPIKKVRLMNDV
jgi:hypothetical protein